MSVAKIKIYDIEFDVEFMSYYVNLEETEDELEISALTHKGNDMSGLMQCSQFEDAAYEALENEVEE